MIPPAHSFFCVISVWRTCSSCVPRDEFAINPKDGELCIHNCHPLVTQAHLKRKKRRKVIYWGYEQVLLVRERSVVKSKGSARKPTERNRRGDGFKKRWGMQLRLTLSYVGVSVDIALLIELLCFAIFYFVILRLPFMEHTTMNTVQHLGRIYELEAAGT